MKKRKRGRKPLDKQAVKLLLRLARSKSRTARQIAFNAGVSEETVRKYVPNELLLHPGNGAAFKSIGNRMCHGKVDMEPDGEPSGDGGSPDAR